MLLRSIAFNDKARGIPMKRSFLSMLLLAGLSVFASEGKPEETAAKSALPEPLVLKARIELKGSASLKATDVKFAPFPEGRRCAFTYNGPKDLKTISHMTKLGFRTDVTVKPSTNTETLARRIYATNAKAVGVSPWNTKGGYSSAIQGNTIQETFDALMTSRLQIRKKTQLPVAFCHTGGHFSEGTFPRNRNFDAGIGYSAAYQDAHFLHLARGSSNPYMVCLGYGGKKEISLRSRNNNTMDTKKVPNELIYYQILASQFEGTLAGRQKGKFVMYSIRDFKKADLDELTMNIGEFGAEHRDIWHASPNMLVSHFYLREKTMISAVKPAVPNAFELELAIDRDLYPPFAFEPLSLALPKSLPIKSASVDGVPGKVTKKADGVYLDLPVQKALREGLRMTLVQQKPDMTIPDTMELTLKIKNTSGKPIQNARLSWLGSKGLRDSVGLTVSGGEGEAFTLAPGQEKAIKAKARTARGTRFGIMPVYATIQATHGKTPRTFSEGFEIVVAPMLRVEMFPQNQISFPRGRDQWVIVQVANGRSSQKGGPVNKFISHKAGPCKGHVVLDLPKGMTCEPAKISFDLKEDDSATVHFKVTNNAWGKERVFIKPQILLDGAKEPLDSINYGTRVCRSKAKTEPKALDEAGLLVYAPFDNRKNKGAFARSVGNPSAYYHAGHRAGYSPDAKKGWCIDTMRSEQVYTAYRNIDHQAGTILFWLRRDPKVRNELRYHVKDRAQTWKIPPGRSNAGEGMVFVTSNQRVRDTGICLRRFPGWGRKEGYIELVYKGMTTSWHCQADFPRKTMYQWHHIAMTWDVTERRLELYVNGKLASKADPGKDPWMVAPWHPGYGGDHRLVILTTDHGHWSGTSRDEVYIYNRALSANEIKANMDLVSKQVSEARKK